MAPKAHLTKAGRVHSHVSQDCVKLPRTLQLAYALHSLLTPTSICFAVGITGKQLKGVCSCFQGEQGWGGASPREKQTQPFPSKNLRSRIVSRIVVGVKILIIHSSLKRSEILRYATQMNFENTILSEISQLQKDKYYTVALIWGL